MVLPYLSADEVESGREDAFVLVAGDALEFCRWLVAEAPGLQWIQVENLLGEPEAWAAAARKGNDVALDVIVSDPVAEFSAIYRLVDVRNIRDVRVTIPLVPGFLKSLRLAASIQVPVRLLPGQPDPEVIAELEEAAEMYLHDPVVETPIEFFHSLFGYVSKVGGPDLWIATETDPDIFDSPQGPPEASMGWVGNHVRQLEEDNAECVNCRWNGYCRGFFKSPDPAYSCEGIIRVFDRIGDAALEMQRDLKDFQDGTESDPAPTT